MMTSQEKRAQKGSSQDILFAMQDRQRKFSIALYDVISCILLAEEKGYLPRLPADRKKELFQLCYFFLTMFSREKILETLSTMKQFICLSEEEFVMWRRKETLDRI